MKLKIWDRILLVMYALLGILALAMTGASVLWPEIYAMSFGNFLMDACGTQVGKILGCALIVVLVAGLVHLIAAAFGRENHGPKNSVSVQNAENGAVRVSVQAMDVMVRRAIGNQSDVLDFKSRIINHDDSITVHIDMAVAMDSHIPNITMIMQRNIKRYIEETSGIAVREVIVLVNEVRDAMPAAIPAPTEEPSVEAEETAAAEETEEAVVAQEAAEAEEAAEVEEISETDELLAMEEAAEMEEAAVLEEVLAMEPVAEEESCEEDEFEAPAVFIDGSPFSSERDRMMWEGTWVDDGPVSEEELIKLYDAEEPGEAAEEADEAKQK